MKNKKDEIQEDELQKLSENLMTIFAKYGEILKMLGTKYDFSKIDDFSNLNQEIFQKITEKLVSDPDILLKHQLDYTQKYLDIVNNSIDKFFLNSAESLYAPQKKDKRFGDQAWNDNIFFDFIKQSYLMNTNWLDNLINEMENEKDLDSETSKKARFLTKLTTDALCPSNFIFTNPEVLRTTIDTNGENLIKGLENLYNDILKSDEYFEISTNNPNAFELSKNLACTKGSVVFQNDLIQLIRYEPLTKTQFEIPVLITPPWINKFYILDLQQENSFVKWLLEQGFNVFMISWVNPSAELAEKNFEDYMQEGQIEAMEFILAKTKSRKINNISYCIGGTLLSCTAAYLKAKKKDYISSLTFLTTLVDFSNAGDLSLFIKANNFATLKKELSSKGFFDGHNMTLIFNMLKSNEMIWSFFINHYLLGKDPVKFDLLFWNSDPSRLPAKMHEFYIDNMYNKNLLKEKNGISMNNVKIDLSKITADSYFLGAKEDHIVPWESCFDGLKFFSGKKKFTLTGSGHVAGVINHPQKNKYGHQTNEYENGMTSSKWLASAEEKEGSWWNDWLKWAETRSGAKVKSVLMKDSEFEEIEKAPGSYVQVK